VLRTARDMVFRLADRLVLLTVPQAPRRGIAVIMPHGLGDLVLYTEAFRHLRAHYRDRPVVLVCTEGARAYAESYLPAERIIAFDRDRMRRDLRYRMRIVGAVSRAGVRVAIQPGYNRAHMSEDALVRASRAEERIGSSGAPMFITPRERTRGDRWYTRLIEQPAGPMHDAERNAAFAAALTGNAPSRLTPRLARPPRHPDAPAGGYIVAACDASAPLKAWPPDRFVEASLAMAAQTGLGVVLVGETKLSRPAICAAAWSGVVDLCARTDTHGLISILGHARIVLCNDSAPAHLAAALGVPVVAVGGGGMPERYLPYPSDEPGSGQPRLVAVDPPWPCFGCGWQCRYAPPRGAVAPCVAAITVDQVVGAALALLGESLVASS
jgi:ADP-heptose:LPS heptosyltransferase